MPALAAALRTHSCEAGSAVKSMLAVAGHRGARASVIELGTAAVGVCSREESRDWSVVRAGDLAAAFVGRLDNITELVRRFDLSVEEGRPNPAEVVLELHRRYRRATPELLRGIYSVAITDGRRIECFRDHLGFRSLFYRCDGSGFTAASEAKQVVAGAGLPGEVDADVVSGIFFGRFEDETLCALRGVERLPKSTLLTATAGTVRRLRYWRPEDLLEAGTVAPTDIQDRFDELMTQAADRMVTGDDVVALSGGVDSPAVAAYAAPAHVRRFGRPLIAVTQVYPKYPAVDESRYTQLVAQRLEIPLVSYEHTVRHLDGLERWIGLLDGPVPAWSGNEMVELYRQARAVDRRTILTGEVAEFLVDMNRHMVGHLLLHGKSAALARRLAAQRRRGISLPRLARQMASPLIPRRMAMELIRRGLLFKRHPTPDWIEPDHVDPVPRHLHVPARDRWRFDQLAAFVGPGLTLESEEIRQDVCGVTVRMPFADVDLWEFFLKLRAEQKSPSPQHKSLLRAVLRGRVPDEILDRRDKTYFNEATVGSVDYSALRRWLVNGDRLVPGVRYDALAEHLRREDLDIVGYVWARDLAVTHAFLAHWCSTPSVQEGSPDDRA